MKAKDIKVGVIGYGGSYNMGRGHLREMRRAGMTPTCVVELDAARRKVAEEEWPGIETYASVGAMLKRSSVNLLAIITPHNSHARLALQCLKAGRHVVCEKPMAITTSECDAMIAAARRKRVMVSTYHNRHWDGCVMNALKIIKRGAIGDVFRVEAHSGGWRRPRDWWRSSRRISGGILYDWGVHFLEYTLQIMDAPIAEVTGFAKTGFWSDKTPWKRDTNEDEAFLVVRYADGRWSSLTITSIDSHPKEGSLEVTGTKGTLLFTNKGYKLISQKRGGPVVTEGENPPHQWPRFYKNIADHLAKGTPLVISAEWARRPIHILDLGIESAKKGRALKAKYR